MDAKNLTIKDVPRNFMSGTGHTLADYSVALGIWEEEQAKKFKPIGSGVLVRKGNRFGILTARHCLHKPGPEVRLGPTGRDVLCVVLQLGRSVLIQPQDVIEHPLVTPKSIEFGPDLAFIEVLPGARLGSLKAIGSFWSLDKDPVKIAASFGKLGTLLATIGFPGVHYDTKIDGNTIRHKIHHMAYYFILGPGDVFEQDGWDYIENQCDIGPSSELPPSFKGMSGGPIWGLHFDVDEKNEQFKLTEFALLGISFLEIVVENKERKIRAHFIQSIYDLAWRNLT
jgi:hypothetical protein